MAMLESKINAAKKMVRDHLTSMGLEWEGVTDDMVTKLQGMGGTTVESLEEVTEDDLAAVGIPPLVGRRVIKMFGGNAAGDQPKQIVLIDDDPDKLARRLKPADLVAEYDPLEPDNAFGGRLKEISEGQPFVVFNDDGSVDVKTSARLLQDLRDHYEERTSVIVAGVTCKVYPVGEVPARYGDEHPLRPGELLYSDGYSKKNVPWGTICFSVRQLLYLAVKDTNEIKMDREREREIFDLVNGKVYDEVSEHFVDAAVRYRELEGGQQLPSLKIPLGKRKRRREE